MKKKILISMLLLMFAISAITLSGCGLISLPEGNSGLFHTHEYTESSNIAPTCDRDGYILYTCSCGDSYRDVTLPPLGHTLENDAAVPATCTQSGLTAGSHCTVCGKKVQEQTIIPQLPHQDEQHDGYCDVCNTHFEDVVDIANSEGLKAIGNNLAGTYRLTADISLAGVDWIALGSASNPFVGSLYGQGHSISGLTLANKTEGGLFAYNCGTIEGVILRDTSFSLDNMNGTMGGLAAYNNGSIVNCSILGRFSVSSNMYHYEETKWPSYNGTQVSYTGTFGGVCAVNEGTISNCELNATFSCEYSNTNEYILNAAFTYLECGDSSSCTLTIFFGGVTGKNTGTIDDCTSTGSNANTIHVLAKYKSHGTSTARVNCYIGSIAGKNDSTIKNSRAKKSVFIRDVGTTSLKEASSSTYGVVCELNLYEDQTFTGLIGQNSGVVENVVYN